MNSSLTADFKQGNWNQELCDEIHAAALKNPSTANLILALDVAHSIRGVTAKDIDCLAELASNRWLTHWPLFYRLCSFDVAQQRTDHLTKRLHQAGNSRFTFLKNTALSKFPRVLCHLAKHDAIPYALREKAHQACSLLNQSVSVEHGLKKCLDQITENNVAIVGNGPSLKGSNAGQTIDAHDVVIRFNHSGVNQIYDHDVGKKTDLWVLSPMAVTNDLNVNSASIAITGPDPWTRPSNYWRILSSFPTATFNVDRWHALVRELHAPPSAGILTLDALRQVGVPASRLSVFGFDRLTSDETESLSRANHYRDDHPVSTRHNWDAEARIFKRLISS